MLLILIIALFASLLNVNNNILPKFITGGELKYDGSTQFKHATAANYQLHRNFTHAAINASLTNASLTNNKIEITQTPWWQLLVQFAVSGGVAGAALLGANVALDKYRSPKLSADKTNSPKVVPIELALYNIDENRIPYHLRQFTVPYNVNRILIRNEGKTAAKNSKGVLKVDDIEYRVCWSVPTERSVATINAHSMEYLDLSAGLVGKQSEHSKEFYKKIAELQKYIVDNIRDVYLKEILDVKIEEILNTHKSTNNIPLVIAPTENDWQIPPTKNHVLIEGIDCESKEKTFAMIITAENSHKLEEWVNIREPDDKGRVLEFSKPAK